MKKKKYTCPECKKVCVRNHDGGVICVACNKVYARTATEAYKLLDIRQQDGRKDVSNHRTQKKEVMK
ncbi:MAG: hypothetical protein FP810_18505 [Desulfocapsa sp.]|nr:hypothetical protein [Desulfocapsa sp.]MBU4108146.1 hypothetical protein [Pseudomonadota bacterium]MCG2744283.1 hypothetical protein [Desulfobacteraceae bacterium]